MDFKPRLYFSGSIVAIGAFGADIIAVVNFSGMEASGSRDAVKGAPLPLLTETLK